MSLDVREQWGILKIMIRVVFVGAREQGCKWGWDEMRLMMKMGRYVIFYVSAGKQLSRPETGDVVEM